MEDLSVLQANKIIDQIVHARYVADVEILLNKISMSYKTQDFYLGLIDRYLQIFSKPPIYKNYQLPSHILSNNSMIRKLVRADLILAQKENNDFVKKYIIKNHEFIKYACNQWFLINAGIILEFIPIPMNIDNGFKVWLSKYNIYPNDDVVYRHTISENGRKRLKSINISVPFDHWDKYYTIDALIQISDILTYNPTIKGIWNEGSWIYDPNLHVLASDNKPLVAFDFFKNDLLTGHRFYLGEATIDNEFKKHYYFSTRNKRREDFVKKGEFQPKVFGAVYPRKELLQNIGRIRKLLD